MVLKKNRDDNEKENDYVDDMETQNFVEKVCEELNEMGVLEISPVELRSWVHVGL